MVDLNVTTEYILLATLLLAGISLWFVYHRRESAFARNQANVNLNVLQQTSVEQANPEPAIINPANFDNISRPAQNISDRSNQYQAIFEAVPDCVIVHSEDGVMQSLNKIGKSVLGVSTNRVPYPSIYSVISAQHHDAYRELSAAVFAGSKQTLEYELMTGSGEKRWMEVHAVPVLNDEQQVVSLLSINHDISEIKNISNQLEEQRNQLKTIIESEPECVKLQERDGTIIDMNPAGLTLLNAADASSVIGKIIYEFITEEYVDDYRELTAKVFEGGREMMEFEIYCLDGTRRWMETHAAPLMDNNGQVSALLAITRDISERKRNEEKLREQQIELARVCRLTTMGEMASTLAHELNQPLCAVSSYAQSGLSISENDNPDLHELLDKIVNQSHRATQIIKQISDFVRKQSPLPQSIYAQQLIQNVVDFIEPDKRRKKISIKVEVVENLPSITVDHVQIEQVLLNLIGNAIQAMREQPSEQRKIDIHVAQRNDHELLFRVFNTGPAIPEEISQSLYTPFFTTKSSSMGMGLSISRSIIEAHEGRIWHENSEHKGVCFFFTLPTEPL